MSLERGAANEPPERRVAAGTVSEADLQEAAAYRWTPTRTEVRPGYHSLGRITGVEANWGRGPQFDSVVGERRSRYLSRSQVSEANANTEVRGRT